VKKQKLLMVLSVILVLGLLLTACGGTNPPAAGDGEGEGGDPSWENIQAKGHFVLGLDDSFPPMGFRDENNDIVGFDIDLAREAAAYLGVDVEFKPVVWETVILSLTSGEIDCIWNGMTVTDTRLESIDISEVYMNSDQLVVTLAGSPIKTMADLAGKNVGTQLGSTSVDVLEAHPDIYNTFRDTLKQYATHTESVMDLQNGRLDAIVLDSMAFYGDFNVKSPGSFAVLDENFGTEDVAIGVRQEDDAWTAKLNEALHALRDNGKAVELCQKWFGEDIFAIK
jgi:polar amino acid transport system substrate-binding protein